MKRIIYLGIGVIAVVLVWSAAWFYLAGEVRKNIELLAYADGETTPSLQCATLNVGGYPFHFDADCQQASIVSGDTLVTVPGLRASVQVYQPTHLLASALGPATITDSFTGSKSAVSWTGLQASLRLEGWRIARLSVVGDGVAWNDTLLGPALIASSPRVEFHLLDIPEQHDPATGRAALALYTRAQDVVAPGFAITDGVASIEAELSGIPDDVRLLGTPDLLRDIQQAGGKLKLVSVTASDTNVANLDASGELGLTDRGLLEGQLSVTSTGVAERVGPLIAEPYRTLVLGNPAADGSYTQKLSARDGTIFSGLIPAAALPPLFY